MLLKKKEEKEEKFECKRILFLAWENDISFRLMQQRVGAAWVQEVIESNGSSFDVKESKTDVDVEVGILRRIGEGDGM